MNKETDELTFEMREGVAWIAFNRPEKANALTLGMLEGLHERLYACASDKSVRAIVLTGTGQRTFSAGADLSKPADNPETLAAQRRAAFSQALFALLDFEKPTVAAVNGAACGAGAMLPMLCDAVVAAESARFSLPEVTKGLPTLPGVTITRYRYGDALAADLALSGRFLSSEEARARGIVRSVVPFEKLADQAQAVALALAGNAGAAYAHNKRWLNRALCADLEAAVKASAALHRG